MQEYNFSPGNFYQILLSYMIGIMNINSLQRTVYKEGMLGHFIEYVAMKMHDYSGG